MTSRKSRSWILLLVIIIMLTIAAVQGIKYLKQRFSENKLRKENVQGEVRTAPAGSFPELSVKPEPVSEAFNGCPPEGDGGDPELNRLKNRTDEANYIPVSYDAILNLSWPEGVENRKRSRWSQSDARFVYRYEGTPVAVECYIQSAKLMGPESCNCHGAEKEMRDFHVWLVKNAGDDRKKSIVAEVSPSVRSRHTNWSTKALNYLAKRNYKVRISGWMLMDPEHPEQIGKTRGTIWEIHPVMRIEVLSEGSWVDLDSFEPI